MKVGVAVALALGSAVALNWGYVAQHGAASGLPPLTLRRPIASLRALFTHRQWLVGSAVGLLGWGLYLGALALAPLSIVQAASAGGIGVLALLVPDRLTRLEWVGVAVALLGLVLLAVSLGHATHGKHASAWHVALWLVASLAAAASLAATRSGAALGAAAGVLYAAGDVATKAVAGGGLAFIPPVLAAHGLAFVCLQLGFQRGRALTTIGLATLLTNAVPIAAGIAIFGEGAGALRVASFVLVVVGAAFLARAQGGVGAKSGGRQSGPDTAPVA